MERIERQGPALLLGAALLGGVALTLFLTWEMTFYQDTWAYLINRREITADTVFQPHNEHIVAIPVLIEQLQLRLFGMESARPEYVLLALALGGTAYLLFVYIQRRTDPWLALFATVLVLVLGPAFEVLLWPFELGFIGAVFFGIGSLLALERKDRRGDIAACGFLVLSLGFSSLGVAFASAALVSLLQSQRGRSLGRAYVFLVPTALFALWYLQWGRDAESHVSLTNVLASPRFVVEGVATTVGSVLGLGPSPYAATPSPVWGGALLIVLIAALAYRQMGTRYFHPGLWPATAALAAYWFLAAFNHVPGRDPTASRYQYAGAIFLLMVVANLLPGLRLGRAAVVVGAVATLAAAGPNLVILKDAKNTFQEQSELARAGTKAIEIARQTVAPEFQLSPEVAGTPSLVNVYAERYLEAVDEYGSPAYSESELEAAPAKVRRQVDVVLSQALPLSTVTRLGTYGDIPPSKGCVTLSEDGGGPAAGLRLAPGATRIEVAPGSPASFDLRRFAEGEFPVATEGGPGDSVTLLRIPRDESRKPWLLEVDATQPVRICR